MSKILLIFVLSALMVGQHRADEERCRIEIDKRSDLAEDCKTTLAGNNEAFLLQCIPLINQTSSLKLCKDTLAGNPKYEGVCRVTLELNFLAAHNQFLPQATLDKCGAIKVPSLIINNENLIETKALDRDYLAGPLDFKIEKVIIKKTRLMKGSSTSGLIENLHHPDWIQFHDIESQEPLQLRARKTKISIEHGRFRGLNTRGLVLEDQVELLELIDVDFGRKRIPEGAIHLRLGAMDCPKEVNVKIYTAFNKENMDNDPITLVNDCKPSGERIKIKFDLSHTGLWPELPERLFRRLLKSLLDDKKLEFGFISGNIDCCNINNAWITEWAEAERSQIVPENLMIPCSDLGGTVYNYTKPGALKDACENRNQTPILYIAIVAVIFVTIFLLGFSCLFIMYVLPKKRLNIEGGSETDGPGNSSGVIETRSDHSGIKLLGSSGSASRTGAKSSMDNIPSGASSRAGTSAPSKKRRSTSASKRHRGKQPSSSVKGSVTTAATDGSENSIRTLK